MPADSFLLNEIQLLKCQYISNSTVFLLLMCLPKIRAKRNSPMIAKCSEKRLYSILKCWSKYSPFSSLFCLNYIIVVPSFGNFFAFPKRGTLIQLYSLRITSSGLILRSTLFWVRYLIRLKNLRKSFLTFFSLCLFLRSLLYNNISSLCLMGLNSLRSSVYSVTIPKNSCFLEMISLISSRLL